MLFLQAATETQQQSGNGMMQILMILGIVVIFYFFMIRPQQKRNKEQKAFRENLQKGQKVVTIGGLHGKIAEIQETTITIEVENQVRLKFEKSAIAASVADQMTEQSK